MLGCSEAECLNLGWTSEQQGLCSEVPSHKPESPNLQVNFDAYVQSARPQDPPKG